MLKFSVTKENLYRGLSVVSHIASKNLTLPILQNVRVEAKNGQIELITTNLEIGVRFRIRGKVEEEGEITLPAKVFYEVVGLFSGERVDVEVNEQSAVLECASAHATVRGTSAEEFPVIPGSTNGEALSVPTKVFAESLSRILFSAATDESRPDIHGVYFNITSQGLTLASTDSFRLSEKIITLSHSHPDRNFIVPLRTLQEIQRIMSTLPSLEHIQIIGGENQAVFNLGEGEVVSRLIEGKYPEYQQVIPKEWATRCLVEARALTQLVRGASLFCRSGINDVHLIVSPEQKEIRITASNSQVGEYNSNIPATVEGVENDLILNYKYVLDGISAVGSDTVALEMNNKNSPCVLRPAGSAKKDYTHLIMPIKQ